MTKGNDQDKSNPRANARGIAQYHRAQLIECHT